MSLLSDYIPVTDSQTRIYKNILNGNYDEYGVYHLWLECLYKINLQFSDIINGLVRLLTTKARRKLIDYDKIFILGHKCKDGTIKPAGSCFILISKLIIDSCDFNGQILEKRVKMLRVNYDIMREQLASNYIFMLNEAKQEPHPKQPMFTQIQTLTSTEPDRTFTSVVDIEQKASFKVQKQSKRSKKLEKKLRKIKNREYAERLTKKCNKSDVTYIKFKVTGTTDIGPSLFNPVFPSNLINMSDIFFYNSHKSQKKPTGLAFLYIHPDVFLNRYLQVEERKFKITDDVEIKIKIIDYHTFRSILFTFDFSHKFGDFQQDENLKRGEQSSIRQLEKPLKEKKWLLFGKRGTRILSGIPRFFGNLGIWVWFGLLWLVHFYIHINKQLPNDPIELESILNNELDNEDKLNEFVSNTVTKLLLNGNIILRVLNLPATSTIHQLNLLLGTYTLFEKQIVAVKRPRNNPPDLMDLMIVIKGDNLDKERILDKDHSKTQNDSILICKVSTILELERFLKRNYNNLHKFKTLSKN